MKLVGSKEELNMFVGLAGRKMLDNSTDCEKKNGKFHVYVLGTEIEFEEEQAKKAITVPLKVNVDKLDEIVKGCKEALECINKIIKDGVKQDQVSANEIVDMICTWFEDQGDSVVGFNFANAELKDGRTATFNAKAER